jgi:CheY-like chemotaxis protein
MKMSGGQILVVDDNEMNRDVLLRSLERQGHNNVQAQNGKEALSILREKDVDLLLLDIMMPVMDGYQVLEIMKADERLCHIPVIVLSAVDEIDSVVKCIQLGAEDYLVKPFNKEVLRARIKNCLEKKRLRDQEIIFRQQLEKESHRYESLLKVILPESIVHELNTTNKVIPKRHENVAVLFCDIVGFTAYCKQISPEEVVSRLQVLVEAFEELSMQYELEKIKTVGDAFMITGGLLKPIDQPVLNCVKCGIEMLSTTRRLIPEWNIRVGIHTGTVIAGVIGKIKYLFDLWGDTVNTAQRVESYGCAGAVNVSKTALKEISEICHCESLGLIDVKGKDQMEIFRVIKLL